MNESSQETGPLNNRGVIVGAWVLVTVPLLYGVVETLIRVSALFTG